MAGRNTLHTTSNAALGRTVARARLVMAAERLATALMPFVATLAMVVALALFGLWQAVPPLWAYALTALAVIALIVSLAPLRHFRMPGTAEARRRVEQRSGFVHRPVETLADSLSSGPDGAATRALWDAHLKRARAAAEGARTGTFEPDIAASDPMALRAIPFLLLFVAVMASWGQAPERLRAMVDPQTPQQAAAGLRIDAWVTPPVYTGEPPVFLSRPDDAGGETLADAATDGIISIPQGSTLTVRVLPGDGIALTHDGGSGAVPVEGGTLRAAASGKAPAAFETRIDATSTFQLTGEHGPIRSWAFDVKADTPPTIAFKEDPKPALSGALTLTYTLTDDYGVTGAQAEIEPLDPDEGKRPGRPLYEAPELPLMLPQVRVRDGEGTTTRDLQSHPWAGSRVKMTLLATDDAGHTGRSETREVTLPERTFYDPLARAIVEQRRILALDGDAIVPVSTALDAMTFGAERFMPVVNHYLALRSAYWRLQNARTDDDLRGVVDYLWNIALYIEDGDLSLAERRLRDAQQALMDALDNGASDEEIQRLMQELRQAMNEFLRELAQTAQQMPEGMQMPPMDPSQMLTNRDLERMLDQIENMARSGARDAARQMLSEMQRMMENLRNARRMPQQGGQNQMSEALRQLQEMIQKQQELMDQTFRMNRDGQQGEQQGQPNGQQNGQQQGRNNGMQQQLDQLGQGQQALREQLEALMKQLQEGGMGENQTLGEAGDAMGRAEGNLRGNQPGAAVDDQGDALSKLRQGTQSMMESMMQGEGGEGDTGNPMSQRDPLGRPQRTEGPDLGNTVKVPDEIDIQRAREILQELRKRLSEPFRPKIERDYLERLITPY
ncbi:MAG: TIGR02302 family protein [Rhodobiaceae bacterium]|nr:TIGR02302 family protein [Rhodobiaceae bacterium]